MSENKRDLPHTAESDPAEQRDYLVEPPHEDEDDAVRSAEREAREDITATTG